MTPVLQKVYQGMKKFTSVAHSKRDFPPYEKTLSTSMNAQISCRCLKDHFTHHKGKHFDVS